MKRLVSLILAVILMMSLAAPCLAAEADETVIQPRYTHITTNKVDLVIDETTGIAHCSANCYTAGNYTVEVQYKLQRYAASTWATFKTWTSTGNRYASVSQTWAVYSGCTYRGFATFYVRDSAGNLLEVATSSASYYYPQN